MYIIPETREYLLGLKRRQTENRLLLGSSYDVNDHVCVWDNGKPLTLDYVSHAFQKFLKEHGLPKIRFHELRHTAGSLMIGRGLSAKQVQEYLGHEQISTTLDMYVHLSPEGKKEAAVMMGDILGKRAL